jgi:hypothetical protein
MVVVESKASETVSEQMLLEQDVMVTTIVSSSVVVVKAASETAKNKVKMSDRVWKLFML